MKSSPPECDSSSTESLKLWLAQVGNEYLQEEADPARLLDRARQTWRQQGRSDEWITQHMTGQDRRDKGTDQKSESALVFDALAELATQQITDCVETTGMAQDEAAAEKGLRIAAQARHQLEKQIGQAGVMGSGPQQIRDSRG